MTDTPATVVEKHRFQQTKKVDLFQVWIDLNGGRGSPDWWWNTPPKPLQDAVAESIAARIDGWITQVLPEGVNPRSDGRWDNP